MEAQTGPRIVLIENQFREYNKFRMKLDRHHVVYPAQDEYINFINHIRVFLNPRYDRLRKPAFEKALEMIGEFTPDLLIIDHILVGNHTGETGIALALELRKTIKKPIIFLSRTVRNDIDVCINLPMLKPQSSVVWVPKGYPGSDFTEEPFFSEQILPTITAMLAWRPEPGEQPEPEVDISRKVLDWLIAYKGGIKTYSSDTFKESVIICNALVEMISKNEFEPDTTFYDAIHAAAADELQINKILDEKLSEIRTK